MMLSSKELAEAIISVQPMDKSGAAFKWLYDHSRDQTELLKDGYKPVSSLGLMYIKEIKPEKPEAELVA